MENKDYVKAISKNDKLSIINGMSIETAILNKCIENIGVEYVTTETGDFCKTFVVNENSIILQPFIEVIENKKVINLILLYLIYDTIIKYSSVESSLTLYDYDKDKNIINFNNVNSKLVEIAGNIEIKLENDGTVRT
ncbi:MAG: hypothetical protein SNJ71_04625, partial [Bacteroidales bacterium]